MEIEDVWKALGQRAVAHKAWRWVLGMRTLDGHRVVGAYKWGAEAVRDGHKWEHKDVLPGHDLPDLSDPATLGCLQALVLEAHAAPRANFMVVTDIAPRMGGVEYRWQIRDWRGHMVDTGCVVGDSAPHVWAAALVAAWEAAG